MNVVWTLRQNLLDPHLADAFGVDELHFDADGAASQGQEADIDVTIFKYLDLLIDRMDEEGALSLIGCIVAILSRLLLLLGHKDFDVIKDLLVSLGHLIRRMVEICIGGPVLIPAIGCGF